jgi:hypothetical protein
MRTSGARHVLAPAFGALILLQSSTIFTGESSNDVISCYTAVRVTFLSKIS